MERERAVMTHLNSQYFPSSKPICYKLSVQESPERASKNASPGVPPSLIWSQYSRPRHLHFYQVVPLRWRKVGSVQPRGDGCCPKHSSTTSWGLLCGPRRKTRNTRVHRLPGGRDMPRESTELEDVAPEINTSQRVVSNEKQLLVKMSKLIL